MGGFHVRLLLHRVYKTGIWSPDGLNRVERSTRQREWTTQNTDARTVRGRQSNSTTARCWQPFRTARAARPVNNVTVLLGVGAPRRGTVSSTWQPTSVAERAAHHGCSAEVRRTRQPRQPGLALAASRSDASLAARANAKLARRG